MNQPETAQVSRHWKEYTIVTGKFPKDIKQEVNRMIDNGYRPHGGITYDGDMYLQAMVK